MPAEPAEEPDQTTEKNEDETDEDQNTVSEPDQEVQSYVTGDPAVETATELPADRNAVISITWDTDKPSYGDVAHFTATLIGYDDIDYMLQWQWSTDGTTWFDVEGATGENMDIIYSSENGAYNWRIVVDTEAIAGD